jgi:hypothetical protein
MMLEDMDMDINGEEEKQQETQQEEDEQQAPPHQAWYSLLLTKCFVSLKENQQRRFE